MAASRRGSQVLSLQLDPERKELEGSLLLSLKNIPSPSPLGNRQSPIDIITSKCKFDGALVEKPLRIIYPRRLCDDCVFFNTGHCWKLSVGESDRYSVRGGPLLDRYCLDQIHAHWGSKDDCGSEHLVDGKAFSGEMHFVHWNKEKYGAVGDALDHEDGLMVIGVFFKVGQMHPELEKLTNLMECVQYAESKSNLCDHELDLYNLFPLDTSQYWTYQGSLTTKPYSECVTWIVLQQPIEVSHEQLQRMRSLMRCRECDVSPKDSQNERLTFNYRTIQPRDLYAVRSSFVPELSPRQQSPINIYTQNVFFAKNLTESPLIIRYPDLATGVKLENTGHTWKISVGDGNFEIEEGPLKDIYHLDHVHAHWGSTDRAGSEHLVDGRPFVGELHFVHWNDRYGSLATALTKPDGVAVIGVFLEIGEENSELRALTNSAEEICYAGRRKNLDEIDLKQLLPKTLNRYWSYQGSLTTPPYFECVTWIVMKDPIQVSHDQMAAMRSLCCYVEHADEAAKKHNSGRLIHNYRSVQRIRPCEVLSSSD